MGADFLRKFADDTKIGKEIPTQYSYEELQESLASLTDWAAMWGMQFNVAKCKVMHLGSRNPQFEYKMAGQVLQTLEFT